MIEERQRRELVARMEEVRDELRRAALSSGREPGEVTLVAVSKRHPAVSVEALYGAGQRIFGESYVQEARDKMEALRGLDIRWHFIGGLQSNKAKYVAGNYALVHSVDSAKLAGALSRKAVELGVVQDVLLQVNIVGEAQKSGVPEAGLPGLAEAAEGLEGLRVLGLMTMPALSEDPEDARPVFARLRALREGLERRLGRALPHLSMGMTDDFVQAVEEGATLVRIGTRIFGPRPL